MVDSHKTWAGIGLAIAVVILGVLFFTFYSSEKAIFGKAVDTGYTERGIVMNPVIEELRTVYDTDRDGLSNNVDPDDDDDGVEDGLDAFPLDPTETLDTDNDGVGNNADNDDDNDGTLDVYDAFPLDPTDGDSVDTDSDGVLDSGDAFPLDPTETLDTDGDRRGNVADPDDDNDGVDDVYDAFPLDPDESIGTDGIPVTIYETNNAGDVIHSARFQVVGEEDEYIVYSIFGKEFTSDFHDVKDYVCRCKLDACPDYRTCSGEPVFERIEPLDLGGFV